MFFFHLGIICVWVCMTIVLKTCDYLSSGWVFNRVTSCSFICVLNWVCLKFVSFACVYIDGFWTYSSIRLCWLCMFRMKVLRMLRLKGVEIKIEKLITIVWILMHSRHLLKCFKENSGRVEIVWTSILKLRGACIYTHMCVWTFEGHQ